jgi:hypothetical protein
MTLNTCTPITLSQIAKLTRHIDTEDAAQSRFFQP